MTHSVDGTLCHPPLEKAPELAIPAYLQATYWWAYIHPRGVHIFERQWLVNLILWGNYRRLCSAALQSLNQQRPEKVLQIACAYGDLTPRLAKMLGPQCRLDVIDVLPIQLTNLARKLPTPNTVRLHRMDSAALAFAQDTFDHALLFFLLHEQPSDIRRKTLAEAIRVVRPGGILTIVDYAGPSRLNPLRYIMRPLLAMLEPFARDLWDVDISIWLASDTDITILHRQRYCGGLYQLLTVRIN